MPKKLCCCNVPPPPEDIFCCNSVFFTDFITLYGDSMADHAEVSYKDWIALYVDRPGGGSDSYNCVGLSPISTISCNCADAQECGGGDPYWGTDPESEDIARRCCCTGIRYSTQAPGAAPLFFAYKYSGCNLIWYPREFSFNYDPNVIQCNGFLTNLEVADETIGPEGEKFNSCDPFSAQIPPFTIQEEPAECDIGWRSGGLNVLGAGGVPLTPYYPCNCSVFPHIHGGIYDGVYNRVNVKLNPRQMGYVSYLLPFEYPMTLSEAGCCWCSESRIANTWENFVKAKVNCFGKLWPYSDGKGKRPSFENPCSPGFLCTKDFDPADTNGSGIAWNKNYSRSCFSRGISPYLLRISKEQHKMAYDIWGHGQNPEQGYDFGPVYEARRVEIINLTKDVKIEFKKILGAKSKLKDQYIGFVNLEHHFEMYAYRSNDGSQTIDIQAIANHCSALVSGFEGYSGVIAKKLSAFKWTPWKYDSMLYQIRRAIPRRVIYKGSGLPLFHFDLVRMENRSIDVDDPITKDGENFDGAVFLSHYYRYFYGLSYFTSGVCRYAGDDPGPKEWDFSHYLNSYEYVRYWLEKMIETGILTIKDHAKDISTEVNKIIASGAVGPNDEILISDDVSFQVGGASGYLDLVNFFEVEPGTVNATTTRIIKEKLLNTDGLNQYTGPSGDEESFRAFLPKRAILPPSEGRSNIIGWGYTGPAINAGVCAFPDIEVLNDPTIVQTAIDETGTIFENYWNNPDENSVFSLVLSPQRLVSGIGGTFVIDRSGKIDLFGYDYEGVGCTEEDLGAQYPPNIGCIPTYLLGISCLFKQEQDDDGNSITVETPPEEIPDGRVIDLAFKKSFVVALVDLTLDAITSVQCTNNQSGDDTDFVPAFEFFDEPNANGTNNYIEDDNDIFCKQNDPFYLIYNPPKFGPRLNYNDIDGGQYIPPKHISRNENAYRLKSWGSDAKNYGTFSLSPYTVNGFNLPSPEVEEQLIDNTINPEQRMYPGANSWFIWTKISSGVRHFAAIDDFGGLFITPQSDNTFEQSKKGIGVTLASLQLELLEYINLIPEDERDQSTIDIYLQTYREESLNHSGFEYRFNYFPHIPKPGFVKDGEWNQSYYNKITLKDTDYKRYRCACNSYITAEANSEGIVNFECPQNASGPGGGGVGGGVGGGGSTNNTCSENIFNLPPDDPERQKIGDAACVLMGSLVEYDYPDFFTPTEHPNQPKYIDVSCGHYNTLCLTNENKLEIYGKYLKIDPYGEPLINDLNPVIDTFIPGELLAKAGSWDVEYAEDYKIQCWSSDFSQIGEPVNVPYHTPIKEATYNPPSANNEILRIESSCDYSMCLTGDNVVHVWGDLSMIPDQYSPETYVPGKTGYAQIQLIGNVNEVKVMTAGANSFYIHYRTTIFNEQAQPVPFSVTYSFTRYNLSALTLKEPTELQSTRIQDISSGYNFAIALYNNRQSSKIWKAENFAQDTLKYQFKNFNSLPFYFKRQAFFHAIPGGWDYSKWLYGNSCCGAVDSSSPFYQPDNCAILRYNVYNNQVDDNNRARSGNPHYYWMRPDWRRSTTQATDVIRVETGDLDTPNKCLPDNGINVGSGGTNFNSQSGDISSCLSNYGPVWGSGRPLGNKIKRFRMTSLFGDVNGCDPIPCTDPVQSIYRNAGTPGDCPLLCYGVDVPVSIGYRATKDIFQKMSVYYTNRTGQDDNQRACVVVKVPYWSYFKYSERHFYFGYDRELDEWNIYPNPDFLKDTSPKQTSLPIEVLESLGATSGKDYCQINGFGGGTGPDGGNCAGCSAYFALQNEPMTGPNYAVETIVETPARFPIPSAAQATINRALAPDEDEGGPCSPANCLRSVPRDLLIYAEGPGALMWAGGTVRNTQQTGPCVGGNCPDGAYQYAQTFKITQTPRNLLSGTDNNLTTFESGEKISFSDVLLDSSKTEIISPWLSPTSSKWIPIVEDSPTYLAGYNTENGSLSQISLYLNYPITFNGESTESDLDFEYHEFDAPGEQIFVKIEKIERDVDNGVSVDYNLSDLNLNNNSSVRIEKFITSQEVHETTGTPAIQVLNAGLINYNIRLKTNATQNDLIFFSKLWKLNTSNNQKEFIGESLRVTGVYSDGLVAEPVEGTPPENRTDFVNLTFDHYLTNTITFSSNERLVVELFVTGEIKRNLNVPLETADSSGDPVVLTINYRNSYEETYSNEQGEVTAVLDSYYSRIVHSELTELELRNICFAGGARESTLFSSDPNAVDVEFTYDNENNINGFVVSTVTVDCKISSPCCPE